VPFLVQLLESFQTFSLGYDILAISVLDAVDDTGHGGN